MTPSISTQRDLSLPRSFPFSRTSVNKVNTKVDMRLDLAKISWIPDEVKDAMRQLVRRRPLITADSGVAEGPRNTGAPHLEWPL
jgi:hypothetical protein